METDSIFFKHPFYEALYVLCLIILLHLQIPRAIPSHIQHYAPPPLG